MRPSKTQPRFLVLATAVSLSVVALGGTFLLAGCGGGSGSVSLPNGTNNGGNGGNNSGSSSGYAGRSYSATDLSLPGGIPASVTLKVSATNAISGTLTLFGQTVPLSGTLNTQTGAFSLTGTLSLLSLGDIRSVSAGKTDAKTTDAPTRQAAPTVTVTGTLPTPPATSGGSVTVDADGNQATSGFRSGPTPSPSPTTSPSPSPSPSTGPGTGSGMYGDYFNNFVSTASDTFTFNYTTQSTENPDPQGSNSGPQSGSNTYNGAISPLGVPAGPKDTVTIQLPLSGSKVVTREALINPGTSKAVSYDYYVDSAAGRTYYGDDSLDSNGRVDSSTRYEGGAGGGEGTLPNSLSVGQSFSTTYTEYDTEYNSETGAIIKQYNYSNTAKVTFVDVETISVAAGTFANVGHFRFEDSYIEPAASTGGLDQPTSDTTDLYISKFAGRIKDVLHNVTQNKQGTYVPAGAAEAVDYTYTETFDGTNELASATVNGTNYPPGRSVRVASPSSPLPKNWSFWPFHHRH